MSGIEQKRGGYSITPTDEPDEKFCASCCIGALLSLLDRIGVEQDASLAAQRFDLMREFGFTVVINTTGPASSVHH